MEDVIKGSKLVEKLEQASDKIELEDAEFEYIYGFLERATWTRNVKSLATFIVDMKNVHDERESK